MPHCADESATGAVSSRWALPWYYGWNIVAAGVIIQTVTFGIGFSSFTYLVIPWTTAFDASRAEVQIALMAATIGIGVLSPLCGWLLDQFSNRLLITLGAVAFAVGLLLISLSTALWQIIVIYALLLSIGLTLVGPLATSTLTAKWFRARRGLALGIVAVGTSMGAIVFPPLVTTILAFDGSWRVVSLILAILSGAILIPIAWFVVRSSPEEAGVELEPDSEYTSIMAADSDGKRWSTIDILRSPVLWITVAGFLPTNFVYQAVQSNLGPFAADLHVGLREAGFLIPVVGSGMLVGKLIFGTLADRIDNRLLFWSAVACLAASLLLMRSMPGYVVLLAACGLIGFGIGANLPLLGSIVATRFGPQAFGRVTGIVYMLLTVCALGPVIGAHLRDASGSYASMMWYSMLLLVPSVIAISLLPGPRIVQTGAK